MFTTPTKTPKFRLRSYDNPIRTSPGGPFFAPSTPFTPAPYKFSSPRKLNLANPVSPSPRLHRVDGYYTPSPRRMQRLSPRRKSAPPHLNPEPVLSAIIEETSAAVHNTRVPLSAEEKIYFNELSRLGVLHSFHTALADARKNVNRGVKDGSLINAELDGQSQSLTKAELLEERRATKAELEAEQKARIKRELARRKSFERRAQREREEDHHREKLAQRKRRRLEREQRAKEAQATSPRSRDPPSPLEDPAILCDPQPLQTDQHADALAAQRRQEELEAARVAAERQAAEEAQARLAAQQEEARLQEEAKRLEEERFRIEMERSQAAKARKRAEEERARAEMAFARAEEELRKAEEMRQWAQRQQEERLRAMQQEARLAAQRKAEEHAQREAERREQEARIQAEREAFAQRQAEMRHVAEQVEHSFSERRARLAELQRLEEMFEARLRAELEELAKNANRPRNPLAEFYIRQAAQRAAEQEQARRQYMQDPPQGNFAGAYEHPGSYSDVPMGEPPSMDASMHSVCDETPDLYEPSPEPQAPPRPPTILERFTIWEAKWKAIDSMDDLHTVAYQQLPWPVLHDVTCVDDITSDGIRDFLSHSDRPPHLSAKKVISYYHSDKFRFRVMHKMHPHQQTLAAEIANHCTILLVNLMR